MTSKAMWTVIALAAAGGASVLLASGQDGAGDAPSPPLPAAVAEADPGVVTVWKSPTCGCCAEWVEHMREAGFQVEVEDVRDIAAVKREHGIDPQLSSCHTALVDGYLVEGHVPAEDVRRLLAERPDVAGLAVPGMPVGSPGMEVPGRDADPYAVVAFTRDGRTSVFARH